MSGYPISLFERWILPSRLAYTKTYSPRQELAAAMMDAFPSQSRFAASLGHEWGTSYPAYGQARGAEEEFCRSGAEP